MGPCSVLLRCCSHSGQQVALVAAQCMLRVMGRRLHTWICLIQRQSKPNKYSVAPYTCQVQVLVHDIWDCRVKLVVLLEGFVQIKGSMVIEDFTECTDTKCFCRRSLSLLLTNLHICMRNDGKFLKCAFPRNDHQSEAS